MPRPSDGFFTDHDFFFSFIDPLLEESNQIASPLWLFSSEDSARLPCLMRQNLRGKLLLYLIKGAVKT